MHPQLSQISARAWRPFAAARPPQARRAPRSSGTAAAPPLPPRRRHTPRAAIRGVESFDGSLVLDTVSQDLLTWSLQAPEFEAELAAACRLPPGTGAKFTGRLFQPVPWSSTTKHGMPAEMEVRGAGGRRSRVRAGGRAGAHVRACSRTGTPVEANTRVHVNPNQQPRPQTSQPMMQSTTTPAPIPWDPHTPRYTWTSRGT